MTYFGLFSGETTNSPPTSRDFALLLVLKAYRVFNKNTMVVEKYIHVIFDESKDYLERRESVDDNVGLGFFMGRLQIEDGVHQQEEEIDSKKKEESPFVKPG